MSRKPLHQFLAWAVLLLLVLRIDEVPAQTLSVSQINIQDGGNLCTNRRQSRNLCVTLPEDSTREEVDLFFLIDDTETFQPQVEVIQRIMADVIAEVTQTLSVDLGVGIGRFADYGGDASGFTGTNGQRRARPFILNQPILTQAEASRRRRNFQNLIDDALGRSNPSQPGFAMSAKSAFEALFQVAEGSGFDGNGDELTTGLRFFQLVGRVNTQTNPDTSGDVPAFSTRVNSVVVAGDVGGVGFRPNAIKIVIVATNACAVAPFPNLENLTGSLSSVYGTIPAGDFQCDATELTPSRAGVVSDSLSFAGTTVQRAVAPLGAHTVPETIEALVREGIRVVGMAPGGFPTPPGFGPSTDESVYLSALSRITGAVSPQGIPLLINMDTDDAGLVTRIVSNVEELVTIPANIELSGGDCEGLAGSLELSFPSGNTATDVDPGDQTCFRARFDLNTSAIASDVSGTCTLDFQDTLLGIVYGTVPFSFECTNDAPLAQCRDVPGCNDVVTVDDVNDGSVDPESDPIFVSLSPEGPYPAIGGTNVTLIVSDGVLEGTCQALVNFDCSMQPSTSPSLLPSATPSLAPSGEPSDLPSLLPSTVPSSDPSTYPSSLPSLWPSGEPSGEPSDIPSLTPSASPSVSPSALPSSSPSSDPSGEPSSAPSDIPSLMPSGEPSGKPSAIPSLTPSASPSASPSTLPSSLPSSEPSGEPSSIPSDIPSLLPSGDPSGNPSTIPSLTPSASPSASPSVSPTLSSEPSSIPSLMPSGGPSSEPSDIPSLWPSGAPSDLPSLDPSSMPSSKPSVSPSVAPTTTPSVGPSARPSVEPTSLDPEFLSITATDDFCVNGEQEFEVCLTVSSQTWTTAVDVFFLLDSSSNFVRESAQLSRSIRNTIAFLQDNLRQVSFGFGVGRMGDYGGPGSGFGGRRGDERARPFILNQPIVTAKDAGGVAALDDLIYTAVTLDPTVSGGNFPDLALAEALHQIATGLGFDADGDGTTTGLSERQVAGIKFTQNRPDTSGDIPAYSTLPDDIRRSGKIGGVGFRQEALKIVILGTESCLIAAYKENHTLPTTIDTVYSSEASDDFVCSNALGGENYGFVGNALTPDDNEAENAVVPVGGAALPETIRELATLGVRVIGLSPDARVQDEGDGPSTNQDVFLSALARSTGAVDQSGTPVIIAADTDEDFDLVQNIVSVMESAVTYRTDLTLDVACRQALGNVTSSTAEGVTTGDTACFSLTLTPNVATPIEGCMARVEDAFLGIPYATLPISIDCRNPRNHPKGG